MSLKVSSKDCIKVKFYYDETNGLRRVSLVEPYTREDLYKTIAYHMGVLNTLRNIGKKNKEMSFAGFFRAVASLDIIHRCVKEYAPYKECKKEYDELMKKAEDLCDEISDIYDATED